MFAIAVASVFALGPLPAQWASFSRAGAMSRVTETVDIAIGGRLPADSVRYKLRFTKQKSETEVETKWADSFSCPAVRSVIADMHSIVMPSPTPFGIPNESDSIILDGAKYVLTAPSTDNLGSVTLTSNVGSPLAQWVDQSLNKLTHCWTVAEP